MEKYHIILDFPIEVADKMDLANALEQIAETIGIELTKIKVEIKENPQYDSFGNLWE